MIPRATLYSSVIAAFALAAPAWGSQQTATPAAPPASDQIAACGQAQPIVSASLEAALTRLENARQTNSAAALRAAADDLQATLIDVRARLAPCTTLPAAAGDAHAGHTMPNAGAAPAASPGTPAMAPGSPRPAPGAPVGAPAPPPGGGAATPAPPSTQPAPVASGGAAGDAHPSHMIGAAAPGELVKDPRCAENVNPQSAPQAAHDGRTYYFCTESDRQRFVADPARYLASAGTAADPHAGHVMPVAPARSTGAVQPPATSAAADPHAGHALAAAAAPPATGGTAPNRAAPAADHAGHSAVAPPSAATAAPAAAGLLPAPPTNVADLKCRAQVNQRTAPRMLYQGRMYYFCSEQDRAAFAKDPSNYALPAGEAAPAHAH